MRLITRCDGAYPTEERLGVKMVNNLKGRRKLLYLWQQQNGICPVCQPKITKLAGWHNHHIVPRTDGGEDDAENLVLLHPSCHNKVHNQGWKWGSCVLRGALERLELHARERCAVVRSAGSLTQSI